MSGRARGCPASQNRCLGPVLPVGRGKAFRVDGSQGEGILPRQGIIAQRRNQPSQCRNAPRQAQQPLVAFSVQASFSEARC